MNRCPRFLVVLLAGIALWSAPIALGATTGDAIVAAGSENEKAKVIIKNRGSLSSADVLTVVKREKNTRVAALAMGIYFESATKGKGKAKAKGKARDHDGHEATEILRAAAGRKELIERGVVMAATNPSTRVADIVHVLLEDGAKAAPADHLLAARILATHARILDLNQRLPTPTPAWCAEATTQLLGDANPEVVELALLSAAYLRVAGVQGKVRALEAAVPTVQAARLLYQARLQLPVDPDQVARIFSRSPAAPPEFTGLSPAFLTYEVRVPSWCLACAALGELGQDQYLKHLHAALDHADVRVRIDAARAIERIGSPQSVPVLVRHLKQGPWPVKLAVVQALATIPSADAIAPLIEQLAREKGRLRLDIIYTLSSITRGQFGQTVEHWNRWWNANKDTFRVDRERTREYRKQVRIQDLDMSDETLGSFYEIPILSDRVIFVPDTSNSMHGEKIASLKRELSQQLKNLKPYVQFNVVNFGGIVEVMQPGKLMSSQQIKGALDKVADLRLSLGTRTYDAIETAFLFPEVDTIFVLTDGKPVGGQFVSWERIISAVALINRYRPITIHTLEFIVPGEKKARTEEMKELARRNTGRSGAPQVGR